jgi:hypothetical protein
MMAGVGPFAVPLAMPPGHGNTTFNMTPGREIVVHANGRYICTVTFVVSDRLQALISLAILDVMPPSTMYLGAVFIVFSQVVI